jgi:hypothetical protein
MRVSASSGWLFGSGSARIRAWVRRTNSPGSRAPPKTEPQEDTHGSVLSKLRKPPEMHAAIVLVGGTADTKRHLCSADKESASVKAVPGAVVAGLSFGPTILRAENRRQKVTQFGGGRTAQRYRSCNTLRDAPLLFDPR